MTSGQRESPCCALDFSGKAFTLWWLGIMLTTGLWCKGTILLSLICWGYLPWKDVKCYKAHTTVFSASQSWFLSFVLLKKYATLSCGPEWYLYTRGDRLDHGSSPFCTHQAGVEFPNFLLWLIQVQCYGRIYFPWPQFFSKLCCIVQRVASPKSYVCAWTVHTSPVTGQCPQ